MAAIVLLLANSQALAQEKGDLAASAAAPARIRLGGSVGAGLGSMGLGAAASGRVGIQITPLLAVSYQITAAGTTAIFGDDDSWTSHALLVEFVPPGSMFSLGAGPSIVSGTVTHACPWGSDCNPPPSTRDYVGRGIDARMGYTFGANRLYIRGGFTLELALHISPEDTAATMGIGFDIF